MLVVTLGIIATLGAIAATISAVWAFSKQGAFSAATDTIGILKEQVAALKLQAESNQANILELAARVDSLGERNLQLVELVTSAAKVDTLISIQERDAEISVTERTKLLNLMGVLSVQMDVLIEDIASVRSMRAHGS